eukprot:CAMPEP_0115717438 /NCGR_PEP_ID=MMETSP0272-20121206/76871_1 /TAXON_ID=71861 /ORGANISM="Scrippsiella trochoidea, Strain CCMP3099" /LENGTH=107 /DNA_ID=CAMNT_0003159847 /DNA_START=127 /DNA_END=446 /DNA_ORIENTATION=-
MILRFLSIASALAARPGDIAGGKEPRLCASALATLARPGDIACGGVRRPLEPFLDPSAADAAPCSTPPCSSGGGLIETCTSSHCSAAAACACGATQEEGPRQLGTTT